MLTMEMAQRWLDEAEADARLAPIMKEVEARYEVGVRRLDKPEWSSSVKGNKAEIGMAVTGRHLQSFAHELLHLRLSARGYRHILGAGNHDPHQQQIISAVLDALDNELQHHRMFPEFVNAGFDGGDFYAESDDDVHVQLQSEIEELRNASPAWQAVLSYFTLIAPGGRWPDGKREELVALLKSNVTTATWDKLAQVEALFDTWRQQSHLDPTETIVSIFETLGGFEGTYLAEDVAAYPAGSFIPRTMTPDEFMALAEKS
ncbi:hypothetical protein GFM44_23085 [Rhizobium leguminosarum bv. viciae]|nr:hypothetical protein [Rhizobium leguminosarum bv. viciae]